ncbi:5'-methylthioadenosine/S-adenosylhomocysteine nucleosidase family protein [Phytohabitans sp. LJ34]|uniref:5'-methylthioadenosine/S-adenosylhomocysteine nucleosidase family protein n=1 Tax=Phytohabitans sp. LJ34 TaxID=3452217 RepID=UPI003F896249
MVLTAIKTEYEAIRSHLVELKVIRHRGTFFEIGTGRGSTCRVALAIIGDGNQTAATLTERASALFTPKAMLFVGVAGGLRKEVKLGDVVVGTLVYNYHSGVRTPDGFRPRVRSWEAAHELVQIAHQVERTGAWKAHLESSTAVHFAPIVAGEVLQDGDVGSIRARYDDAAAVDMEDSGVLRADHLSGARVALTIRGISDPADGTKKETDAAGWKPKAAANAAAFAMALIRSFSDVRAEDEARERWARRVTRRRLATAAVVSLLVFGIVAYYAIRLALDGFYGALGAEASELPIGVADMVGPLLFQAVLGLAVTAVALIALVAGAALLPAGEPTRAAVPATALATMLCLTTFSGLAFISDSVGRSLAVVIVGMLALGLTGRAGRQKAQHLFGGAGIGAATLALLFVLAAATNRWLPGPWPLVLFFTTVCVAMAFLGLWIRRELRLHRRAEDTGETTPWAFVKQAWTDVMPSIRDFRGAAPRWRAHRIVAASLVASSALLAAVLWGIVSWLDGRATAGRIALDLGYVPFDHESAALPTPVRPATITPRHPGEDPLALCRRPPDRAASVVASDGDSYWVLLRPIGDSTVPPEVVRLPSADYEVRLVPDAALPDDGEAWTRPAC